MQRHTPTHFEKNRKKAAPVNWEVRELKRLVWALLLFLTVFLGKKIYPDRMLTVGEEVIAVLGSNMELNGVFRRLGTCLEEPNDLLHGIETFCVEVFGAQPEEQQAQSALIPPQLPGSYVGLLSTENITHTVLYAKPLPDAESEPSVSAVGTVLAVGDVRGLELPDGYTMDKLSLGSIEPVVPVFGVLTSGYGYRNHPISGKHRFHGGVDIGAEEGTPIAAFADGMVEYVGEDNSYGLYLQIDHGNGVKSFYAHCRELCIRKGQQVMAGDTIALVGSTGTTTGPHLHLEVKCEGVRVDPAHYMSFQSIQ